MTNPLVTFSQRLTFSGIKYWAVGLAVLGSLYCYWGLQLDPSLRAGLAILTCVGILWFTEAVPLTFTALLIPVLAVMLGVSDLKPILSHFAHPIIFLFLGGFALAAALTREQVDQRIGDMILRLARAHPIYACYALFAITAGLSMWISNTATAAMMLPVALGIASRFGADNLPAKAFLLLGMAYSANIGGMATLIGSPPNAIAAAQFGLSFLDWLQFGLPAAILLIPLMVVILRFLIRPTFHISDTPPADIEAASSASAGRTRVITIFVLTVCGWIFSKPLSALLGVDADGFDSLVALIAIAALGFTGSLPWRDIEAHSNWGILLLFGGGLALSSLLRSTGTSAYLGELISSALSADAPLVTLLIIAAFVVFLTEMVSNTASAALLIPLFGGVAEALGIPAQVVAVMIALCASCAFMLPVATPPNAIVFGSGYVSQATMIANGLWLNLCCIVVIGLLAYIWI